jgi:small subunit ribosomal protein S21
VPGVRVKEGESFERALRRFKKRCEKAGVLSDLRKHAHFEKPSERKKRKRSAAKRKLRKLKIKQLKRKKR